MSKSRIFFYGVVSFLAGVTSRSFFEVGMPHVYAIVLVALVFATVFYGNKKVFIFSSFAIFLALGIWRTDDQIISKTDGSQNGKTIKQTARVVSSPVSKNGFDQIVLEFKNPDLQALANIGQYSDIAYGDKVEAGCSLKIPENKDESFDYRMYLAKDGIGYICDKAAIKKISSADNFDIFATLTKIKNYFQNKLYSQIPQPEGALAAGLIFGGGNGLSPEMQNSFSRTGTTHIIAVSGYNVTIVAEYFLLLGLALGFWRKQALWFAIVGIILFVVMVGMPASAVRAGVMGSIVLWALKNGRLAESTSAIILAGALMLFYNPLLLRWDIGFQLSFLATIGVVVCSGLWQKSRFSEMQFGGLSEIIVLTLGAQIFVWPILAYNFQTFSVISLVANILVLPIIPLSMLLVFLVSVSGFFAPYASFLFAWIAYLPLRYETWVIRSLGNISWASIGLEKMSGQFLVIYYILLMAIVFKLKNSRWQTEK